jgi:sugar phosphate isomerase/epimerase
MSEMRFKILELVHSHASQAIRENPEQVIKLCGQYEKYVLGLNPTGNTLSLPDKEKRPKNPS